MTGLFDHSREVGGIDPLDSSLGYRATVREVARLDVLLRSRAALGLAPASAPGVIFLPLGFLLGPHGLNLLTATALAYLSPVVTVGLAALGVFVGLGLGSVRRVNRELLRASSIEASVTVVVVALAIALVGWVHPAFVPGPVWTLALVFGIIASASSAGAAEVSNALVHRIATRIADLDDIIPIVAGGLILAWMRVPTPAGALWFFALTIAVALLVAFAGWLLLDRANVGPEHVAFFAGVLLLLGGSAQFLSVSALFAGMVAGVAWASAPGGSHEIIRDLLGRIQHPVVVLLLLAAGAQLTPAAASPVLLIVFVAFRIAGKFAGGWLIPRLTRVDVPERLGLFLTPPGVIGVAFALNVGQVLPAPAAAVVLGVAVLGSVVGEFIGLLLLPRLERRR
jgi:hypothetical protein